MICFRDCVGGHMAIKTKTYRTKKDRESIISKITATNEPLPKGTGLSMEKSYDLWTLYEAEQKHARLFLKWAGVPDDLSDEFSTWCQKKNDDGEIVGQASYEIFATEKYPDISGMTTASETLFELLMFKLSYENGDIDEAIAHILRAANFSRTLVLLRHEDNIRARKESDKKLKEYAEKRDKIRCEYTLELNKLLQGDKEKTLTIRKIINLMDSLHENNQLPIGSKENKLSESSQRNNINAFILNNEKYLYIKHKR